MIIPALFKRFQKAPARLYMRCSETPLDVFIDCVVNKNIARLIRSGEPTRKELEAAWQRLWFEYCDLSGSPEFRQLFALIKETAYLEGKLTAIRLAATCIRTNVDSSCINILRGYGYTYKFDKTDPLAFERDVQKVISKSKSLELLISNAKAQIESINSKSSDQPGTERYFEDYLSILSKYMGFRISRKVTTVAEFIRLRKMYEIECEKNKPRKHGK